MYVTGDTERPRTAEGGCPHMIKAARKKYAKGFQLSNYEETQATKPLGSGLNPTAGQRISAF